MWQHVDNTIRDLLGRHHAQHEPGGKDQVRIPIGFLTDVHAENAEYADLLYYNEPEKLWVAANLSELPGGPANHYLDDLIDVDATNPALGDVISWNPISEMWETGAKLLALDSLTDVDATNPALGDLIVWNDETEFWEHKPAKDALGLGPGLHLDDLIDVAATAPNTGDTIVFNAINQLWENKVGGGGSGKHQAHMGLILPASVVPPGPTNITGAAYTVRSVQIASDGEVWGLVGGCGSYSFGFGTSGGTINYNGLANSWGDGSTITLTVNGQGNVGSYLTVDIALEG
jgi:hypothetical protein